MAQTKKRATTRKKGATTRKKSTKQQKKQKDNALKYVFAIIITILTILGAFQLGIVGRMIDSFFNYLVGTSRYLTYILILSES